MSTSVTSSGARGAATMTARCLDGVESAILLVLVTQISERGRDCLKPGFNAQWLAIWLETSVASLCFSMVLYVA